MINNRQAGRRRGRGGGQRQGGNPGNPQGGNRIDNRARGNAAQLLEKYKSLAADAQRSGDRVNTEYYLQFADHYFRVLSEQRGRFEEQNQQRRNREESFDDEDGEEFEAEGQDDRGEPQNRQDRGNRQDRDERQQQDRPQRDDRRNERYAERQPERMNGRANGFERDERPRQNEGEPAEAAAQAPAAEDEAPRRRGRPRRERQPEDAGATMEDGAAIEADRLPPAFARPETGNDDGEEPRPRRRLRSRNDEPSQSAA